MQMCAGVPAGIGIRREALPVELGAFGSGGIAASVGDTGENLVSEPTQQVEAPAGDRTRNCQHGTSRCRRCRRPATQPRTTSRLPQRTALAARCRSVVRRRPASGHAHRKRMSPPAAAAIFFPACVGRVSFAAELPSLLSVVLQWTMRITV